MSELEIDNFAENGCALLGSVLDAEKCEQLRAHINEHRPVCPDIFYSSLEEFEEKGRWSRYAPGPGHNFLDSIDTSFIYEEPGFQDIIRRLAGSQAELVKAAIIRSVPGSRMPEWVLDRISDVGRPNMNPFVRDEFQDVQYFYFTDYHQDQTRPDSNFVTVYIYLDPVSEDSSALNLLVGSHVLGLTTYPHLLRRSMTDEGVWYYSDTHGNHVRSKNVRATGGAGDVLCFHCLTLHGTCKNDSDDPRISLRLLYKRGESETETNLVEEANSRIIGKMHEGSTRLDVDPETGQFLKTGASILP